MLGSSKRLESELRSRMVCSLSELRAEDSLSDLEFLVGPESKVLKANSTVMALCSPFFRALCFGPMSKKGEPKHIPDVEPSIFERVLAFAYAEPGCLQLESLEQTWLLRAAANQFLIEDLYKRCDDVIIGQLTYRTALSTLHSAHLFKAEEHRRRALRVIRHRHEHVLHESEDLSLLELEELVELVKLYKFNIKADSVLLGIFRWWTSRCDEGLESEQFRALFRAHLFSHIQWETASAERMFALHEMGLLNHEMENKALLSILLAKEDRDNDPGNHNYQVMRMNPLDPKNRNGRKSVSCKVELQISAGSVVSTHSGSNRGHTLRVSRLVVRTLFSYFNGFKLLTHFVNNNGCLSNTLAPNFSERAFTLDPDSMKLFRDALANVKETEEGMPRFSVDQEDVNVTFSTRLQPMQKVTNLKVVGYPMQCDHKDVFFFVLTFDPVEVSTADIEVQNSPLLGAAAAAFETAPVSLVLEVSIRQELMLDLRDHLLPMDTKNEDKIDADPLKNMLKAENYSDYSTSRGSGFHFNPLNLDGSSMMGPNVRVSHWASCIDDKVVWGSSNDSGTTKFFMDEDQRPGVPFIARIN